MCWCWALQLPGARSRCRRWLNQQTCSRVCSLNIILRSLGGRVKAVGCDMYHMASMPGAVVHVCVRMCALMYGRQGTSHHASSCKCVSRLETRELAVVSKQGPNLSTSTYPEYVGSGRSGTGS